MITLPQFALLIAIIGFYNLYKNRSKQNMFHLDYLLYHVALIILVLIIYNFYLTIKKDQGLFRIVNLAHLASLMYFFQHIEATLKGYKSKFKNIYVLFILAYTLLIILNESGIYLLDFQSNRSDILLFYFDNPKLLTDLVFFKHLFTISVIIFGVNSFYKLINKCTTVKKKKNYTIWFYSYSSVFLLLALLNFLYFFELTNPKFDSIVYNSIRIVALLQFVFFIFYPSLLSYLPTIKIEKELDNINYFKRIENLFINDRIFLKKNLKINEISKNTGLKESEIRSLIKYNRECSINDFINDYRLKFAKDLIINSYLEKHTVISLAESSGFGSHQTFFRAFKKKFKSSPNKFKNEIMKS